jgi:hypothetical protein
VRRLRKLDRLPKALGPWALDSGGFSELSLHGRWRMTVEEYIAEVRRYVACIGKLQWAAAMDSMCEPPIRQKTGLTVEEHQRRTIENYLELRAEAPELPWAPVLQGWSIVDYWTHENAYARAGVDLAALPVVGVGSVCRRQGTTSAGIILATLASSKLRLHAFGMKVGGLRLSAASVISADSLAWSFRARRSPPLKECEGRHPRCQNCLRYALRWRRRLLHALGVEDPFCEEPPVQGRLF